MENLPSPRMTSFTAMAPELSTIVFIDDYSFKSYNIALIKSNLSLNNRRYGARWKKK
jgi:hypothetical protein